MIAIIFVVVTSTALGKVACLNRLVVRHPDFPEDVHELAHAIAVVLEEAVSPVQLHPAMYLRFGFLQLLRRQLYLVVLLVVIIVVLTVVIVVIIIVIFILVVVVGIVLLSVLSCKFGFH
jgi:uncharacterized membrane protein YdfJ with MMPL/SSD domain